MDRTIFFGIGSIDYCTSTLLVQYSEYYCCPQPYIALKGSRSPKIKIHPRNVTP